MIPIRIWIVVLSLVVLISQVFAAEDVIDLAPVIRPTESAVGSWAFSGMATNESGERYGYFFQMQKEGNNFHVKTALIDGQTNELVFYYNQDAALDKPSPLNWHVGNSFMRYNPINDSWIFGVKLADQKGFNFKIDMLKQTDQAIETLELRPGVKLQALQTSRLNGHVQLEKGSKEQFITGNNAWFAKLWINKEQKSPHKINTTFCRLSNDNGFYSANLKERDATSAAHAGWRDAAGNKVKMSQFISVQSLAGNQSLLKVGLPKLNLKLTNTLQPDEHNTYQSIAGFSKDKEQNFCYLTEHSFSEVTVAMLKAEEAVG